MYLKKLRYAENAHKNFIKELETTFRVPSYMSLHAEVLVNDYKEIIHDLLAENKKLREEVQMNDNEYSNLISK